MRNYVVLNPTGMHGGTLSYIKILGKDKRINLYHVTQDRHVKGLWVKEHIRIELTQEELENVLTSKVPYNHYYKEKTIYRKGTIGKRKYKEDIVTYEYVEPLIPVDTVYLKGYSHESHINSIREDIEDYLNK